MKINKPPIPELLKLKVVSPGSLVSCAEYKGEVLFVPNRTVPGMDDIGTEDDKTILFNIETGDPREISLDTTVVWHQDFDEIQALEKETYRSGSLDTSSTLARDLFQHVQGNYQISRFTMGMSRECVHALMNDRKIESIKLLRQYTNLTLRDSKYLMDSTEATWNKLIPKESEVPF